MGKDNDTGARLSASHRGRYKHDVPAKVHFGTTEEIHDRVGGSLKTLVSSAPTNFKQLGPDGSGGNMNDHSIAKRSGDQKFGNPRRYA